MSAIPHQYTLQHWFCLVDIPNQGRHILRATGVQDKAVVQKHIEQMHLGLKVIELHPLKDHQEIVDAAAQLAADPNWTPMTNEQFKESRIAAENAQDQQIPAEVLNNPIARPIVDASGQPLPAPNAQGQQPQIIPIAK